VAWNAEKTRVLRDAATIAPGDMIHVTLSRGEIDCEVLSTADSTQRTPGTPR
jgi:hypothetical protein